MQNLLLRILGNRATHRALATHTGSGGVLDIQFGLALMRDRRVPIPAKLLALLLGAAGMGLLVTLELPVEAMVALVLPALGFMVDSIVDGLEGVVGPFLLAALLLPHLAPASVVETVRDERHLPYTATS